MNYNVLQAWITYADTVLQMGVLPAGSLVLNPYIVVTEAFNSDGTDLIRVGTEDNDDAFGTDHDVSSTIVNPANFAAGVALGFYPAGSKIIVTYTPSGSAPTTGAALVIVPFLRVAHP